MSSRNDELASFGTACNVARGKNDWVAEVLSTGLAVTSAWCCWDSLAAADRALLPLVVAASFASAVCRRRFPSASSAWREWLGLTSVLCLAAAPSTWRVTGLLLMQSDSAPTSFRWPVFTAILAIASGAATCNLLALTRPMRLRFHLPTQAALVAAAAARNAGVCHTAALQHPSAVAATATLHRLLTAATDLLTAMPGAAQPASAPAAALPQQRCTSLLLFLQLVLALGVPTVVLAAAESRLFAQWQRRRRELATARSSLRGGAVPVGRLGAAAPPLAGLHASVPLPPRTGATTTTGTGSAVPVHGGAGSSGGSQALGQAASAPATVAAAVAPSPSPSVFTEPGASLHTAAWWARWLSSTPRSDLAVPLMYRTVYRLLADPADPWLKWLLAVPLIAACWNVTVAVC